MTDKQWFLLAVLVFGLCAICASGSWLNEGKITIRGKPGRGATAPLASGRAVGEIRAEHPLYYPVIATWLLLGVALLGLAPCAWLTQDERLMKASAYTLAAILPLGFLTVGLAMLVGP